MANIKKLPQNLINLIAAGEVVERPASAVKELIENSIDALATKIIVRIENFETNLIEVEDNGIGMNREDAKMALEQHATSKISKEEDLDSIYTLGFRGEALASIAAVSAEISIETKTASQDSILIKQVNQFSNFEKSKKTTVGTIIKISGLFSNIPARKKFLKSNQVEFKHISQIFINTALAYKHIHFELWHENKEIYKLTKVANFKDRIHEIWGNNLEKNIFDPVEYTNSGIRITAFLGSPEAGRRSGDIQYTYINNRSINNKTIYQAALEGYRGFLHKDLKPCYFYFLEINPKEIDINIHPRKNEVRFENSQIIFQSIYSVTKKTLENNTKFKINESMGDLKSQAIDPATIQQNLQNGSQVIIAGNYKNKDSLLFMKDSPNKKYDSQNTERNYTFKSNKMQTVTEALFFTQSLLEKGLSEGETNQQAQAEDYQDESYTPYQIFNTYIVYEKKNSVIYVDQHAAAEKITFEKLYKNYGAIKTKPLLLGDIISLKKHDKAELLSRKEELTNIGIIIDDFGGDEIQVLEIPEIIEKLDIHFYFQEILNPNNEFKKDFDKTEYNSLTNESYLMLATEACHGSIRAGQRLSTQEMYNLLKDLNTLKNPYNCPHGRPVMWELTRDEIEKNFRRKF